MVIENWMSGHLFTLRIIGLPLFLFAVRSWLRPKHKIYFSYFFKHDFLQKLVMSKIPGRLSFIGNLFTHYLNLCNYDEEVRASKILHFYDILYTLSCVEYSVPYLSNSTCLYFSIILGKIAGWVEKGDLIDIVFREELQCVLNSSCTSESSRVGDTS